MTDKLRRQWKIWHISLAVYMLLLGAAHVASSTRVTVLTLQPHVETHLNVVSVLGHDIYMDLEFRRSAAKSGDDSLRTRELGGIRRNSSGAEIIMPGEPVVIEAAVDDGPPIILSATPGNRANRFIVSRSLRADGVLSASFSPDERDGISRLSAHPGLNHLTLRVVQVGSSLLGEDIELIAQPPMRAIGPQSGYGIFVIVFWLLPVAVIGFFISGMLLFVKDAEKNRA